MSKSNSSFSGSSSESELTPPVSLKRYMDPSLMIKDEKIPYLKNNPKLKFQAIKWIIMQKEKTKKQIKVY